MMADYLHVEAERRNGLCLLRITGELDTSMAETFADQAEAVMRAMPGPVLVYLSGLTFTDAHGAHVLATVIRTLRAGRLVVVRSCPAHVRRVVELLGLPPDYLLAWDRAASASETCQLVDQLRRAQLDASEAKLGARTVLSLLTDTCIRLASTRERTALIREQGRRTVACSRAAREHLRPREAAA